MNPAGTPMTVILWICAAIFFVVGCWAARRRDPMHFWAGTTVPPEAIRDIPAYNRACARMWRIYGGVFVFAGIIDLFSMAWAGILTAAACVFGLPALIFTYQRIFRKYKR